MWIKRQILLASLVSQSSIPPSSPCYNSLSLVPFWIHGAACCFYFCSFNQHYACWCLHVCLIVACRRSHCGARWERQVSDEAIQCERGEQVARQRARRGPCLVTSYCLYYGLAGKSSLEQWGLKLSDGQFNKRKWWHSSIISEYKQLWIKSDWSWWRPDDIRTKLICRVRDSSSHFAKCLTFHFQFLEEKQCLKCRLSKKRDSSQGLASSQVCTRRQAKLRSVFTKKVVVKFCQSKCEHLTTPIKI